MSRKLVDPTLEGDAYASPGQPGIDVFCRSHKKPRVIARGWVDPAGDVHWLDPTPTTAHGGTEVLCDQHGSMTVTGGELANAAMKALRTNATQAIAISPSKR